MQSVLFGFSFVLSVFWFVGLVSFVGLVPFVGFVSKGAASLSFPSNEVRNQWIGAIVADSDRFTNLLANYHPIATNVRDGLNSGIYEVRDTIVAV